MTSASSVYFGYNIAKVVISILNKKHKITNHTSVIDQPSWRY